MLVAALAARGIPVESHFYERGAHGFGFAPGLGPTSEWPARMAAWLAGPALQTARSSTTWARGIEGQRQADLGDGTFLNPILAGDHPDPSILKDGDDYYMTFSSFDAYPGLVIWHSRDLVNWQPIGPALFKNVGSVWAPDLVKHRGRYYIYFPGIAPYRSNYVIWADNIRGPWSEPIDLKITRIDPGHAVGPDGQRYLFLSAGELVPLADDGLSIDGTAEEDLRRLEVPGRLGGRDLCAGRAEDPQARRLLLHGACRGRHRGAADRPHDRRRRARNRSKARGRTLPTIRSCAPRRATSAGGRRDTARWSTIGRPVVDGLSRLRERLLHARAARRCSSRSSGPPTAGFAWPAPTRPRRSRSPPGRRGPHGFAFSDDFSTNRMGLQWSFYTGDAADRERYRYESERAGAEGQGHGPGRQLAALVRQRRSCLRDGSGD